MCRIAEQLQLLEPDGEALVTMDSITLVAFATELEAATGITLPLEAIFDPSFHSVRGVVAALGRAQGAASPSRPRYVASGVTVERATVAQEYFYYLDRDDHDARSYYATFAFAIEGPLDVALLARSYDELVSYHSVYRTAFREVDGVLQQVVVPLDEAAPTGLEVVDRSPVPEPGWAEELERAAGELVSLDYDLARATGLIRSRLVRFGPERHGLVALFHHIAMDGASVAAFREQLFAGYARLRDGAATALPPAPALQYIDYAHTQQRWLTTPAGRAHHELWSARLRDAPPLELAGDFPREPIDARRDRAPLGITADVSHPPLRVPLAADARSAVLAAARAHATTPFAVYASGLVWLLHERSGQTDIAIQASYSPRMEDPALGPVQGCLTTWQTIRVDITGASSFPAVIDRTAHVVEAAHAHGMEHDYYRRAPHGLRRVAFNYLPGSGDDTWRVDELTIRRRPWPFPPWKRPWDLHLTLIDHPGSAQLLWTGCERLFRRETVIEWLARYVEILGLAHGKHSQT